MATDEFRKFMHLHLKSKFASNEFCTKFELNLDKISERYKSAFALVRQSIEQPTVSKTHASMSVGGHALPPHTLILKWLMSPTRPQSSKVVVSEHCLRAWSENPRSVLLSSMYSVL